MKLTPHRTIKTNVPCKSFDFHAVVVCGPETAAKLGVPVGTEIELGRVAYWHRNPVKRWLGQRKLSKGFDPDNGIVPA